MEKLLFGTFLFVHICALGVQEGETPLPYRKLLTVTMLLFGESVNGSAIFSYVPYLVLDFKPGALEGMDVVPKTLAGYYAGLVASSFFFGQLLSSYFWGNLSDRFGRRPILLFGSLGSLISNLFFGFGRSFWWFVFFRFLTGFLNGNVGVAKSYIGEVTDSTNQSRGLAFIGLSSGGVFLGAFMGGLLARPAKQYPTRISQSSLFGHYPYLAPSLFGASVILLGLTLAYFFIEENTTSKAKASQSKGGKNKEPLNIAQIFLAAFKKAFEYSVFKDRVALWACLNYALIGLFMIFDAELWPLLTVLDPKQGGLGFSTRDIGLAQASTGISFTITSLFLQSRLTNRMGFINASVASAAIWGAITLFTPYIHVFSFSPVLMWTFVIINRLIRGFVGQIYFGCAMALINNSVIKENLGAVNGVGQTFVSLARTGGPFLSANLFAWSASNGLSWPLNYHLPFLMVVFLCCVGALEAFLLPRSLNQPKEEQFLVLEDLKGVPTVDLEGDVLLDSKKSLKERGGNQIAMINEDLSETSSSEDDNSIGIIISNNPNNLRYDSLDLAPIPNLDNETSSEEILELTDVDESLVSDLGSSAYPTLDHAEVLGCTNRVEVDDGILSLDTIFDSTIDDI